MLPLGLLVLGLVAGVLSGMFGIGGGLIIVSSLVVFGGFSLTAANGTSLAVLLLPVGIFACIEYYKAGKLKLVASGGVALGLLLGAWFGARIALGLDPLLLKQLYGVFLLYMAWRYISPRQWWQEYRGMKLEKAPDSPEIELRQPRVLALLVAIGFVAGIASGLFGIGGGVVIVPALTTLLAFELKLATGTSLGALLLPVGLPGVIEYASAGLVDVTSVLPIALGLAIGAIFGARFALGLPAQTVRRLYGLFLLFIGIRFIFNL
jgi:hypothetical protein